MRKSEGRRDRRQVRARFSFRDDDTAPLENCFELVQVKITVGGARCSACRYDSFLGGKLNDERLYDASK